MLPSGRIRARAGFLQYGLKTLSRTQRASRATSTLSRLNDDSNAVSTPQIYLSASNDPYLNLSIEHYLYTRSAFGAHVLFLYVNRPALIIGRNQNPWVECNLPLLLSRKKVAASKPEDPRVSACAEENRYEVELVRRRSGGGAVYHDLGNLNWTLIGPKDGFTRDKGVEMVVAALRNRGKERIRVNERHDIVMNVGENKGGSAPTKTDQDHKAVEATQTQRPQEHGSESRITQTSKDDLHSTPYQSDSAPPLKISGSAYKLTKGRALHHGTLLLQNSNLQSIHDYLRSPSKPFITAKGAESVSSPVGQLNLSAQAAAEALQVGFFTLHDRDSTTCPQGSRGTSVPAFGSLKVPQPAEWVVSQEEALGITEIKKGYEELRTLEWKFGQTPGFVFSTYASSGTNQKERPELPGRLPKGTKLEVEAKHGHIVDVTISFAQDEMIAANEATKFKELLIDKDLFGPWNWTQTMRGADFLGETSGAEAKETLGQWLDGMLPIGKDFGEPGI